MSFEGTIVKDAPAGQHYRPKHGHPVKWMRFEGAEAVRFLNTAVPYANNDEVPRYGGGDYAGLAGLIMMVKRGERKFGEAHAILEELFRQNGITDPVTEMEAIDFACMNGPAENTDALGLADWMRLTGKASPIIQESLGTVRNPIIVADPRFPANHKMEVDGKWYMNDFREGRGLFPVTAPPSPPQPDHPPLSNPPTTGGQPVRQIRYTFGAVGRSEVISLPPGTTGVLFKGTVTVPPLTGDAIRPWIGIRVGDREGDRENAAMVGVGGREQIRVEAGGVRSKEFQKGFGKVTFGKPTALEFEWGQQLGAGKVRILYGKAERTYETGVTEGAERGGRLTLGVDPGGEYQLLPAGTVLEGALTITGAASSPVPVDPPVVQPPAAGGTALAQALAHLDAARALLRTLAGLLLVAVLLSGLACKDRATVEKPRQPPERPVEQPVEVPAPPLVAPSPPMERPVQPPPIFPPGPVVAAAPAPAPAPVNERCYVLRVSGGVPRVTGSMACPAAR